MREGIGALRAPEATDETGTISTVSLGSAPPRLRVQQNSTDGERIVEIARAWIGTPYVHQASLKGVGCDCLGLIRGIWRELYGEEPEDVPPYSMDWAEATGAETLYMALLRHAREVALPSSSPVCGGGGPPEAVEGALAPGDIALFRMLPRGPAKHCGIVGKRDPAIGNRTCDPAAKSIAYCRLPGCRLTLIHSRQNKRVSEEPFSPFWRSKLAFAFRL